MLFGSFRGFKDILWVDLTGFQGFLGFPIMAPCSGSIGFSEIQRRSSKRLLFQGLFRPLLVCKGLIKVFEDMIRAAEGF